MELLRKAYLPLSEDEQSSLRIPGFHQKVVQDSVMRTSIVCVCQYFTDTEGRCSNVDQTLRVLIIALMADSHS